MGVISVSQQIEEELAQIYLKILLTPDDGTKEMLKAQYAKTEAKLKKQREWEELLKEPVPEVKSKRESFLASKKGRYSYD